MPKTGRKHQLRHHLKHIFHPIVGDTKHGRGEHNNLFREKFGSHRLLLYATQIVFIHPVSNKHIVIKAEMDEVFRNLFKRFEWKIEV